MQPVLRPSSTMQMPLLNDADHLRERASQFRETARRALACEPSIVVNALALELFVKADLIDQITNRLTRA